VTHPAPRRWHALVDHTADVGLHAAAPDPAGLLEEAARALAELASDVGDAVPVAIESFEVRGDDPSGLAFAWLNELIGRADVRGEALVDAGVAWVRRDAAGWVASGRARFTPYDERRVRARLAVKAATYHGLRVEALEEGWSLDAYLDV
jgi:SHS2 domain-containing protein